MELTGCNAKVNYISELQDSPSLTTNELKEAFDAGGESIKTYLDDTLIPELEDAFETIPDVVDDITTGGATAALSAEAGKTLLQKKINAGAGEPSGSSGDIFLRYI